MVHVIFLVFISRFFTLWAEGTFHYLFGTASKELIPKSPLSISPKTYDTRCNIFPRPKGSYDEGSKRWLQNIKCAAAWNWGQFQSWKSLADAWKRVPHDQTCPYNTQMWTNFTALLKVDMKLQLPRGKLIRRGCKELWNRAQGIHTFE